MPDSMVVGEMEYNEAAHSAHILNVISKQRYQKNFHAKEQIRFNESDS